MGWDIKRALPRLCPALPGAPRPLHVSGRAPPPRCLRPSGLPINCYTTRVCATRRAGTEHDSAVEDARRARRARGDQRGCRTRARKGGPAPDRPRACAVADRRGALWEPPEPATAATLEPLRDVHLGLAPRPGRQALLSGHYLYYHYGCDGVDDRGWGCGYRTLQTLCSWPAGRPTQVPTLAEVQAALEDMGDKPRGFLGSRDWIGCVEACLCLDYFGGPQGRLCHVPRGTGLRGQLDSLYAHFSGGGGPVMVGGDADAQSKALLGVCLGPGTEASVLVLDPHCWGAPQSPHDLQTAGWVGWRNVSTTFDPASFYNLCLTSPSPDSKGAHSPN